MRPISYREMENILKELASDRDLLNGLRRQGVSYARECLTWDAKARITTQVLNWVVRQAPKPTLLPPKMLCLDQQLTVKPSAPLVAN